MRNIITIVCVCAAFALLFIFDVTSVLVPDAEAVLGVRRRTARRTAVVVGSSEAAAASAANASAAAAQQQTAAAQQQTAQAQQQTAAAQQQTAAQQQAAAPAPTAMVASLPAGCVSDGAVFQCGNVYYKPYMSGNQIVYGVVPAP